MSGERVSNVWNGFDHEVFSPANVARDPHTLLCVARAADPNKGVRDLVRALAKLPEKVRLLLIDDPGPTNPVRIWGKKAGCLDRIEIRGSLTLAELVAVYRQAALLVVPSHYEGFGLPAIEGMACATPVVATTGGALPEVLGDHASLAPPGEPSLLAAAIGRALDERAETATRASRARRFVVERYGWSAIAQRTEAIYHSLVGS